MRAGSRLEAAGRKVPKTDRVPCARIANLQADAQHIEREMARRPDCPAMPLKRRFLTSGTGFVVRPVDRGGLTFGPIGRPPGGRADNLAIAV